MSLVLLHRRETKEDFHLQVSLRRSSLLFGLALPEMEVIQQYLPVRLPCYDFTLVTSPAFGIPLLAVKVTTSGMASSHSVTDGELQPAIRTVDRFLELAHPRGIVTLSNDSHAPPLSAFPKAPLSFKRIRGMSNPDCFRCWCSFRSLRISPDTDAYSPDTVIASSQGKESGPCLSPSVADHPLGPATDHRLGKLLPYQLANQTRAPPRADSSFCSSAYKDPMTSKELIEEPYEVKNLMYISVEW
ncbi:hypothetical protein DCAR_0101470 [Daucus carota subsp. sativus]|uniref:Uncharacterized protein n=1 Tax=Daucus carota subsp. sativus TaxID=79200 RepID=A0AAF1AJ34_DAUCS|nr:hypothetical protein DCAR_0101470 [Daucus carota subsp. sativus]